MKLEDIEIGMPVMYVPKHLKGAEEINDDQLGVVTSLNDKFAFVRYLNKTSSQATKADDLHSIKNRPDLMERLGLEVESVKYTKEEIEKRLKDMVYEMFSSSNQEDGLLSFKYDEEKQECILRMNVHIVEEDDYIGFSSY